MEIINEPIPADLAKPLKAQSLDEPSETSPEIQQQPSNTFWREMLPIGIDLAVSFTSQRYPHTSRCLSESKETLGSSGGYLLDKYVPMNFGGINNEELGHILAVGFVGLGLFKAVKEDTKYGKRESGGTSGIANSIREEDIKYADTNNSQVVLSQTNPQ